MPDFILFSLTALFAIIAFILFCVMFTSTSKEDLMIATVLFVISTAFTIGGIYWLRSTADHPFKVISTTSYQLEDVKMPDGTTIQIISIDPLTKINMSEQFKKVFPPNTKINQVKKEHWSNGIYFTGEPEYYYEPVLTVSTTLPTEK